MGEAVFDLGYENNGESMELSLEDWNAAYKRLVDAAKSAGADCQLLLTKNVGGEVEAESIASKPEKKGGCNGKILIRRVPNHVEDVIETRIAVVGNGMLLRRLCISLKSSTLTWMHAISGCREELHARGLGQGRS